MLTVALGEPYSSDEWTAESHTIAGGRVSGFLYQENSVFFDIGDQLVAARVRLIFNHSNLIRTLGVLNSALLLLFLWAYMMEKKYRQFLIAGERRAYTKVIHELVELISTRDEKSLVQSKDPLWNKLIGEVHAALDQIRQLEKEAEIAELATQVAHDIRSPLLALKTAAQLDDTKLIELRELLTMAIDRIHAITANLRNFSQSRANSTSNASSADQVPIRRLISEILKEKELEWRGLAITINSSFGGDGTLGFAESQTLKRILSNLLNNSAERFTRSPGQIEIVGNIEDAKVRLSIRDNGPGIPADIISQLGKKGVSFGKSSSSGLGLYHAFQCMERWNGQINIKSEKNQGTSVELVFVLPISDARAATSSSKKPE